MDINKLTSKAQEALTRAQVTAYEYSNAEISCFHLFLSLIDQEAGILTNPQLDFRVGDVVKCIL